MTKEELEKKQKDMQDKILQHAEDKGLVNTKIGPICDGIADIEKYLSSSPKIMWILKEPYDEVTESGEPTGGGWCLTDVLNNEDAWKSLSMWQLMIQIDFGIRNNKNWIDMDYIEDDPKMAEELKKMAYINLSKMPGGKTSNDGNLWGCYALWKDILFEQIELYKPDVIIFGKTFQFFKNDLKIVEEPMYSISGTLSVDAYKKDGIILIDAYHPSGPGKGGERTWDNKYVNNIINAYREVSKK